MNICDQTYNEMIRAREAADRLGVGVLTYRKYLNGKLSETKLKQIIESRPQDDEEKTKRQTKKHGKPRYHRPAKIYTFDGLSMTTTEWAKYLGIHPECMRKRLKRYGCTAPAFVSRGGVQKLKFDGDEFEVRG